MGGGEEGQKTKGKGEKKAAKGGEEVESLIIAQQGITRGREQISKEKEGLVQVKNA